jgi:hypothetical protein
VTRKELIPQSACLKKVIKYGNLFSKTVAASKELNFF